LPSSKADLPLEMDEFLLVSVHHPPSARPPETFTVLTRARTAVMGSPRPRASAENAPITPRGSGIAQVASPVAWHGPTRGPRGGSLVLPPRPGWRDLAGRCWHARPHPQALHQPTRHPTRPAP